MKLSIQLKKYCIETELKRLYNSTISSYFKNPHPDLEDKIQTIEFFLTHLDFSYLRSKYKELAGGTGAKVFLEVKNIRQIKVVIFLDKTRKEEEINIYQFGIL